MAEKAPDMAGIDHRIDEYMQRRSRQLARRPWARWSSKTLLFAITLGAVLLGWWLDRRQLTTVIKSQPGACSACGKPLSRF